MVDAARITVNELKSRMEAGEDFTLIDVRNPQAWAESDITLPEAIRVTLDHLNENLSSIPKDRPIATYCTGPNEESSASLAQKLQEHGYKGVWALQGGLDAWVKAGLPVESKQQAA